MPFNEEAVALWWEDINKATSDLAHSIETSNFKPELILGIARGGLVPAVMLAHKLDVRLMRMVQLERVELYTKPGEFGVAPVRGRDYPILIPYIFEPTTLVVDDIYDSGATMRWVKKQFPQVKTATLFHKIPDPPVDYPGRLLDNKTWFQFPWEW